MGLLESVSLFMPTSNFHTFLVYISPPCAVHTESDSWNAADRTEFTHFEKWRKSIYLTQKLLPPPDFLWAEGIMVHSRTPIFCLIWSFSDKFIASFSLNHLARFKFYCPFKLISVIWLFCVVQRKCSVKQIRMYIHRVSFKEIGAFLTLKLLP